MEAAVGGFAAFSQPVTLVVSGLLIDLLDGYLTDG